MAKQKKETAKKVAKVAEVTMDVHMEKALKRNRKASEKSSPVSLTDDKVKQESFVTERPNDFPDYLKEVKELVGGNDVLFKVICQDWTGEAAKYKNSPFGNLERDLISQCWRMGLPAQTCAGHLWLMMKNSI